MEEELIPTETKANADPHAPSAANGKRSGCAGRGCLIGSLAALVLLAASGVALVFVWPAFFYVFVSKKEKAKAKSSQSKTYSISHGAVVFAWILFYVGIVMAVFMTGLEVQKLVAPSEESAAAAGMISSLASTKTA